MFLYDIFPLYVLLLHKNIAFWLSPITIKVISIANSKALNTDLIFCAGHLLYCFFLHSAKESNVVGLFKKMFCDHREEFKE